MEALTYSPSEFAALFGKERTWAYRQLYKGKVQAITELGRTLIPKSEVDRLLMEAGRYLGAKAKVKKGNKVPTFNGHPSKGAKKWAKALKQRKTLVGAGLKKTGPAQERESSSHMSDASSVRGLSRQSILQRLTKSKAAVKQ